MAKFRRSIHDGVYKAIRKELVDARKSLGMTQRELAEKMQVPYSLIGKIETGDRRLDMIEFMEYAKQLSLDPIILLDRVSEEYSI